MSPVNWPMPKPTEPRCSRPGCRNAPKDDFRLQSLDWGILEACSSECRRDLLKHGPRSLGFDYNRWKGAKNGG